MIAYVTASLAALFVASTSYIVWILHKVTTERAGFLKELAQAKVDASQAIADKDAAETRAKIAKQVLAEKVTQDREAFQREIANADAATLADALRRKLSQGKNPSLDDHGAGADGAVAEPMRADAQADTDRLGPKGKR